MIPDPSVRVPPAARLGAVHFVGIGGAGMSGIARILLARGVRVSGSDAKDSAALAVLRAPPQPDEREQGHLHAVGRAGQAGVEGVATARDADVAEAGPRHPSADHDQREDADEDRAGQEGAPGHAPAHLEAAAHSPGSRLIL